MRAPRPTTIRMTRGTGRVPMPGHILLAASTACSSEAATQAVMPTVRPADRSVPVSTMHPPMPSATGR